MKRILVTGVTGQIGYYVAEALQREGHRVFGLERQTTPGRPGTHPLPYEPVSGDLLDDYSLLSLVEEIRPDELYNFAAQSFVPASWHQPILTAQYTGLGVVRLLEAVRRVVPTCRFLQAGSSELFAGGTASPQDEQTPVVPRNPYGVAKAFAFHSVRMYRERYGLFASNAVFYTNESPRRSPNFVFRKVTHGVAAIVAGSGEPLRLGDLDAWRDWGYTPDYAEGAIRILRHSRADDFVIASGRARTVRELAEHAFALAGLKWQEHVEIDSSLVRPPESQVLVGNSAKATAALGWKPRVGFHELTHRMLAHDLALLGLPAPPPMADVAKS